MSHLVALVAPIADAHAVRLYPGFGILGADIPATGDNGGSPVLNDGISGPAEYHWRVVTQPDSGTLTIHPDLSYELAGASDGSHPWVYRLFENGVDQGTATVNDQFGGMTQLLTVANSQQANIASPASATQSGATFVVGSHSQQMNSASAEAVLQTHLVRAGNSVQPNTSTSVAILLPSGGFSGSLSETDVQRIASAVLQAIATLQPTTISVVVQNRDQIAADVWGFTIQ